MANLGTRHKLKQTMTLMALAGYALAAHAGRPITVDDAGVDEVGTGHIDAWVTRDAGSTQSYTVVPAYGIAKGFEIDGIMSRNTTDRVNTVGAQLKVLFTPTQKAGCNFGATLGAARSQGNGDTVNTPFVNGLLTCNQEAMALHVNAGASKPTGSKTLGSWGIAIEKEMVDSWTAHAEVFGQQQSKSTLQVGLKKSFEKLGVFSGWQLDGTVGRIDNATVYSLGTKFSF
jgi:hypothetical protein